LVYYLVYFSSLAAVIRRQAGFVQQMKKLRILTIAIYCSVVSVQAENIKLYLPDIASEDSAKEDSTARAMDSLLRVDSIARAALEKGPSAPRSDHANMAHIRGGCFIMGSPENEGDPDEHPQHRVCLDGYYIDRYEVTQAEYEKVMKKNPAVFSGCPNCPVEYVYWHEAKNYCEKTGKRLPTEAEWENAARGGSESRYYWGNGMDTGCVWYAGNSANRSHPVGQKRPNGYGLYDMLGNVKEWCGEMFGDNFYRMSTVHNPKAVGGRYPVLRGGSWDDEAKKVRCASRGSENPKNRDSTIGFRCASDK
jgi:formylglycine-generating enzyme required for sulfatase activity